MNWLQRVTNKDRMKLRVLHRTWTQLIKAIDRKMISDSRLNSNQKFNLSIQVRKLSRAFKPRHHSHSLRKVWIKSNSTLEETLQNHTIYNLNLGIRTWREDFEMWSIVHHIIHSIQSNLLLLLTLKVVIFFLTSSLIFYFDNLFCN